MADFLDGMLSDSEAPEAEAPEVPVETPAEPQAEPQAEPAPQPEPEPAPEPQPEPEAPKERTVPLATFLDTRDEAKDLKRRLAEYEARERQQTATPNPFDDPEGFAASQHQLVEQRLTQERFAFSDRFARKEHGAEAVDEAVKWAEGRAASDPAFAMSYMREADPIDWIVQQHKRDALLTDIGDPSKLDDWFAREAAKRGYAAISAPVEVAPAAIVQPAAKPVPPPRSIASDRSAAPAVVSPEGERDGFLASIVGK